jgi:hypothetical protein
MSQITTVGVDLAKEVIVVCAGGAKNDRNDAQAILTGRIPRFL